jgi:hypothetical protein
MTRLTSGWKLLGNGEKNRSCTARKEVPVYADIIGILGVF